MQDNTSSSNISKLALTCQKLLEYNHPRAKDAARLAASYGVIRSAKKFAPITLDSSDVQQLSSASKGFDPSQEETPAPTPGSANMANKPQGKPEIESFVRKEPEQQMVRNIHQATVSFIAMADDVNEEDIMKYLLDIQNHMPAKVKSFNWSVTEEKSK